MQQDQCTVFRFLSNLPANNFFNNYHSLKMKILTICYFPLIPKIFDLMQNLIIKNKQKVICNIKSWRNTLTLIFVTFKVIFLVSYFCQNLTTFDIFDTYLKVLRQNRRGRNETRITTLFESTRELIILTETRFSMNK